MATVKRILCAMLIAVIAFGFSPRARAQFALPSPVLLTATSIPAGKPRVIVDDCAVEGGGLVSGAVCEVSITLRNTSTSIEVSSILVTGRWSSDNPPPVSFEKTNQAYVSSIGPTQTRNVVFSVKTESVNIGALDSVPLHLDIAYSFDQSPDNSNTVLLQLPIGDEPSNKPESSENENTADAEHLAGLPFLGQPQYIYIGGSALFALVAGVLILSRLRRK